MIPDSELIRCTWNSASRVERGAGSNARTVKHCLITWKKKLIACLMPWSTELVEAGPHGQMVLWIGCCLLGRSGPAFLADREWLVPGAALLRLRKHELIPKRETTRHESSDSNKGNGGSRRTRANQPTTTKQLTVHFFICIQRRESVTLTVCCSGKITITLA